MSVMLVGRTTPRILREAKKAGAKVLKLIPSGTSTGSGNEGIPLSEVRRYAPVLAEAGRLEMIFSIHAERTSRFDKDIREIEREREAMDFVDYVVKNFPGLRMVVEHASCREMIEYVKKPRPRMFPLP